MIGASRQCMDKLMIDLNKNDLLIRKFIGQSWRNYRNIFAACYGHIKISEEVWRLMKKFEASIVSLTIFSLNLEDSCEPAPLFMPQLKSLKLTKASPKACELVLSSCCEIENLFFQPILDCERVNNSLQGFLSNQRNFIETIEITDLPCFDILEMIINNLNRLKSLKIQNSLRDQKQLSLKQNTSIRTLTMKGFSIDDLKNCLLNLPELNSLVLSDLKLTKEFLEFIVSNMTKLRKLFYWTIEDDCIRLSTIPLSANKINKIRH